MDVIVTETNNIGQSRTYTKTLSTNEALDFLWSEITKFNDKVHEGSIGGGGGGATSFLSLTDTISSYNANRLLFESASAVVDDADLTFNPTNNTLYSTNFSGSGSGLTNVNASLLGGYPASYFALSAHTHTKANITDFVEGDYVHTTGNETIYGNKFFVGDVTVSGTTFFVNVKNLNITDNFILINSGETGTGVTLRYAGIEVDRGTSPKYGFYYDENSQDFRIGQTGYTQAVGTRQDLPTISGISYWNNLLYRFDTSSSLTFQNNSLNLTCDLNLNNRSIYDIFSLTDHTHDTRYYLKTEVYNTGETYTRLQIYGFFANYYTKAEVYNTGETYSRYQMYIINQQYSLTDHTHSSLYYSKPEVYNTGETFSQSQINSLLTNYSITSHTHTVLDSGGTSEISSLELAYMRTLILINYI